MSDQDEARYISSRRNADRDHGIATTAVELGHDGDRGGEFMVVDLAFLGGGDDDAAADGLGQHQPIARFRAAVGDDTIGCDLSGHRQSILDLRIANAVSADNDRTRRGDPLMAAA